MCRSIFLAMVMVLGVTCSGFGVTYYVAAGSTGTGASWADAYGSLDSALAVAVSGDTVLIADGIYVPSGATFTVAAGVTIQGGYCNYWTSYGTVTQIGQFYNPKTYQAVLSGDTNGDDKEAYLYGNPDAINSMPSRADNKDTIMTLSGDATIDGFLFWHGGKTPTGANGGGIACGASGSVSISHCEFMSNAGKGAGVYGNTAEVIISDSLFQSNGAGRGAIYSQGVLSVSGCTFKGNSNCSLYGNGIYWGDAASCTVSNCMVVDSVSGVTAAYGSLYFRVGSNAAINVSRCIIRNDEADASSTYMYNTGSTAVQTYTFTNCLWAGCEGNTSSGTIGIRSRYAGASTTVNIVNCTVADNNDFIATGSTAGIKPSGGRDLANTSFALNIKNTILWSNIGSDLSWETTSLSFTDTSYNPFHISYCCMDTTDPNNWDSYPLPWKNATNMVFSNPQFVGNGDYHLQSTSPCIDKGDPASAYANEPKWLNGCRVNMGCYGNTAEAATTATCAALTADITGDCKVTTADLLQLRAQWLRTCP